MGLIQHHAVVATTWSKEDVDRLRKWIAGRGAEDSYAFAEAMTNGYTTIVLTPDGSKEGWETSDVGDKERAAFIEELKKSGYWEFVEVGYGETGASVVSTNCENMYE